MVRIKQETRKSAGGLEPTRQLDIKAARGSASSSGGVQHVSGSCIYCDNEAEWCCEECLEAVGWTLHSCLHLCDERKSIVHKEKGTATERGSFAHHHPYRPEASPPSSPPASPSPPPSPPPSSDP